MISTRKDYFSLFILLPGKDTHVLTTILFLNYSNLLDFELLLFLCKEGHIGYNPEPSFSLLNESLTAAFSTAWTGALIRVLFLSC